MSALAGIGQLSTLNRKLFNKLDANDNGMVSFREMRESGVLRKLGVAKTDQEEEQAFNAADSNHDGNLSKGESYAYFGMMMVKSKMAIALIAMMVANESDEDDAGKTVAEEIKETDAKEKAASAYKDRAADRQTNDLNLTA